MATRHDSAPVGCIKPTWIRLPKNGHICPYSGMTRSYLHGLVAEGKIKSFSLKKPGQSRGVRLISYDSLMAYLEHESMKEKAA